MAHLLRGLAAILFGLCCACLSGSAQDSVDKQDLASVIAECEKSTVRLEVRMSANGPKDEGIGSGFVVDASGLIATNAHVVEGAHSIKAVFPDGTSYDVVGTLAKDEGRDICIAKIDAKDLPTVSFAKAAPRKGEKIVALGCPVGLSFTATQGIVSAVRTEKEMQKDVGIQDVRGTWIQIDASISPGNSGGPLINETGEVVAMSTLGSILLQNLNFGISGADVQKILETARNRPVVKLSAPEPRPRGAIAGGSPRLPSLGANDPSLPNRRGLPNAGGRRLPYRVPDLDIRDFEPPPSNNKPFRFTNTRPDASVDARALKTYVETGRNLYATLYQDLISKIRICELDLEEFRLKAERRNAEDKQQSKSDRDEEKREMTAKSAELIELKEVRDSISPTINDDSLIKLLQTHGPALDRKSPGSIGVLGKCRVLHVMSKQALFISEEENDEEWALLWVDSTEKYRNEQTFHVGPVLFTGEEPLSLPPRFSTNIPEFPVYVMVDDDLFRSQVSGDKPAGQEQPSTGGGDSYRTWTDATGKFSIEAVLVNVEGDNVNLRTREGKSVTIVKSKLSAADRKIIDNRE